MSRLGFKTLVYLGEARLGELDFVPVKDENFPFPNNEIRIHHKSSIDSRSHPLSVLQSISESGVICKLEPCSNPAFDQYELIRLHSAMFYERKTAVVMRENDEVHLVAMQSRLRRFPCFWCYSVPKGLYDACVGMLNLRCLAIVFDLDETLIVANTMKSFEDKIEQLKGWLASETDKFRFQGMSAELNRYMEDRALLKQYAESDCVLDGGKVYKVQQEEVPKLFEGHEKVVRPIIRLPEKNIVFTRINPENRDTSVLVRLRPAWEELRSYLTTKDRKRFEVYVCTMAERDYALEMWRLLDPQAHLISLKELLDRVVCVRSGARKSLLNVFQGGHCHPKMTMVIDDRLRVWEDKDQPRVHVVPAFTPYYAPQAEMAAAVPVLCVARNVACNVRTGFFNYFDEYMDKKIGKIHFEDDLGNLPSAPDVSNYLMAEDAGFPTNGNGNALFPEGLAGAEVAQKVKEAKSVSKSETDPVSSVAELKPESSQLPVAANLNVFGPAPLRAALPSEKPGLLGVPFRPDNSFSESDPDGKMRFPMMSRGQEVRYRGPDSPLIPKLPGQFQTQSHGGSPMDEEHNTGNAISRTPGHEHEPETVRHDKQHSWPLSHSHSTSASFSAGSQIKKEEVNLGQEGHRQNQLLGNQNPVSVPHNQSYGNSREHQSDGAKWNFLPSLSIGALQEIGRRCNSKVEFRPLGSTSEDLRFSFEVLFTGEKIGFGMGKTRKDAQQQAAENALQNLADKYLSHIAHYRAADKDIDPLSPLGDNGFIWETVNPGSDEQPVENGLPKKHASEEMEKCIEQMCSSAGSPVLPLPCLRGARIWWSVIFLPIVQVLIWYSSPSEFLACIIQGCAFSCSQL